MANREQEREQHDIETSSSEINPEVDTWEKFERWMLHNIDRLKLAPVYLIIFLFFIGLFIDNESLTYTDLFTILASIIGFISAIVAIGVLYERYLIPFIISAFRLNATKNIKHVEIVMISILFLFFTIWAIALSSFDDWLDWIFFGSIYVISLIRILFKRDKNKG